MYRSLGTIFTLLTAGAVLPAQAQPAQTHVIEIEAMQFMPSRLEVRAGDTVIWKNKDPYPHTATANATPQGKAFDSGTVTAGRSWKYKAVKKGSIPYFCALHTGMKGELVVK
ncbi:MAG: hypothetical protein JWP36_1230 [Paucimonas sp.]|nr:hypothetical protein [Paucimonas sp.]